MRMGKKPFVRFAKTVVVVRLRIANAVFGTAAVTEFVPFALKAARLVFVLLPSETLLLRRIEHCEQIIAVKISEKRFGGDQKIAAVTIAVVFNH